MAFEVTAINLPCDASTQIMFAPHLHLQCGDRENNDAEGFNKMKETELTVKFETDMRWKKGDIIQLNTQSFKGDYKVLEARTFTEEGMKKINLKLEKVRI